MLSVSGSVNDTERTAVSLFDVFCKFLGGKAHIVVFRIRHDYLKAVNAAACHGKAMPAGALGEKLGQYGASYQTSFKIKNVGCVHLAVAVNIRAVQLRALGAAGAYAFEIIGVHGVDAPVAVYISSFVQGRAAGYGKQRACR